MAIRIAWRDFQSARAKFLLIIVAIAAAVAVVTAIADLSRSVREALALGARQWLAADIQVRASRPPGAARMEALRSAGWEATLVTETVGQISGMGGSRFEVAAIKAIDPQVYPFYGVVVTTPPSPLKRLLDDDSAVVSPEVLAKLHASVGQTILVGGAEFKVTGIVEREPDRLAVVPLALMRVILSTDGLLRTGMLQRGATAVHRLLFRLPPATDLERARQNIGQMFPQDETIDYRTNAMDIAGIEEQATAYFGFLAFIGVTVAALGVGLLMHTHVQQRLDTIAILKLLGGTSGQAIRIYALQIVAIATAGAVLGFLAGAIAEHAFPRLLGPYLAFPLQLSWPWRAGLQAITAGVVMPILFSLSPLLAIRAVRPNILLRRHLEIGWQPRASLAARVIIAVAACAILALTAVWSGASQRLAGSLILSLGAGVAVAGAAAITVKTAVRTVLSTVRHRVPAAIRYGAANLARPGSLAPAVGIVLGLGVCFVYLAYLIEGSLARQVLEYSPFHGANLYVLNVGPQQKDAVTNFMHEQPGVERAVLDPFVMMRLFAINGVPIEKPGVDQHPRRIRRSWFAAIAGPKPATLETIAGAWWRDGESGPMIALSKRAAASMQARIGDLLEFSNGPELVRVRVVEIHRGSGPEALRYHLTLNPGAVTAARVTYNGGIWAGRAALEATESGLHEKYPAAIVLSQAEIATVMQDTAGQVAGVLQLIAGFSLAGGALILAASIFALRFERELEVSVFKVLGATQARLIEALCSEFTLLGVGAALVGILLANALGSLLGAYAFDQPLETFWSWPAAALTLGVTVAVTNIAGWAAGASVLKRKPNEILRGE